VPLMGVTLIRETVAMAGMARIVARAPWQ